MEIKSKSESAYYLKVIRKNQLFFCRKLVFDKDFLDTISTLIDKYYTSGKSSTEITLSIIESENIRKLNRKDAKNAIDIYNSHKNKIKLYSSIKEFLKKFNLGNEWLIPILILVTTGKFCPPTENLYIKTGAKCDPKRVVLILNPDTSIKDIKIALKKIKRLQKKLWPDFMKINVTKNSFAEYSQVFAFEMAKIAVAQMDNASQLTSYEKIIYKSRDYSKEVAIKKINHPDDLGKYRKKRFEPKLKISDTSFVDRMNITKNIIEKNRFLNKMRQQRKRQKK